MKEPPAPVSASEAEFIALNKGDAGARLLRDQDFNSAYQELLDESLTAIATSKPGQKELREDAYYRLRGIQELAYKLNSWKVQAEEIRRRQEAPVGREQ
jgi:hypothetical protein